MRLATSQVVYNVGYGFPNASELCKYATLVSVFSYLLFQASVYTFLWLKQRSLYQHPVIKDDFYKGFVVLASWSSILVVIATGSFCATMFVLADNFSSQGNGCSSKPLDARVVWPYYFSNGVVVMGQAMMLALFLYPLKAQNSCSLRSGADRMMRLFRRNAIVALVCIISDTVASLNGALSVSPGQLTYYSFLVFDFNALVNIMGMLFTFETWRDILRSPFCPIKLHTATKRPSM